MDSWDIAAIGKMLEVARRQGFITSTFQDGPNGEKLRLYHSFDYQEHDWTIDSPTPDGSHKVRAMGQKESDESSNEATSAPEEPFVVVLDDKKEPNVVAAECKEDIYNFF